MAVVTNMSYGDILFNIIQNKIRVEVYAASTLPAAYSISLCCRVPRCKKVQSLKGLKGKLGKDQKTSDVLMESTFYKLMDSISRSEDRIGEFHQ